jgi:hypothetical protein
MSLSNHNDNTTWIPEGYVKVVGLNNECFVVPQFFLPALKQNLVGQREKKNLNIEKAAGTVSIFPAHFFLNSEFLKVS